MESLNFTQMTFLFTYRELSSPFQRKFEQKFTFDVIKLIQKFFQAR